MPKSQPPLRNRIRGHRTVKARDLIPHPLNWRTHPEGQREALQALYDEVGFARSLLAYELPDGRLQLIDGHLRRDLTPDAEVTVEVLDVTEDEAKKLLLAVDPLAALAGRDEAILAELHATAQADSAILQALFDAVARNDHADSEASEHPAKDDFDADEPPLREQFLILITCVDEAQQADLLDRFAQDGLAAKPMTSFALTE